MNMDEFTIGEMMIIALAAKISHSSPKEVAGTEGISGALMIISKAASSAVEDGNPSFIADQLSEVIDESRKKLTDRIESLSREMENLNFAIDQYKMIAKDFEELPVSEMKKFGITYNNRKFRYKDFEYENVKDALSYAKRRSQDTE